MYVGGTSQMTTDIPRGRSVMMIAMEIWAARTSSCMDKVRMYVRTIPRASNCDHGGFRVIIIACFY